MSLSKCTIALGMVLGFASVLPAATVYTTFLSSANEVPPTGTGATGSATLTLNGDLLNIAESFTGLTSPATGAHIHCCAPLGTNTAIAVPFTNFPAATSGIYTQTYDLTMTATYTAGFLTLSGGTAAGAEAALIAGMNAGQTYLNIHDANYPGGEIRGQLALQAPTGVPEPTTTALFLAGLVPLLAAIRNRARRA